jgi:hypothetical protein
VNYDIKLGAWSQAKFSGAFSKVADSHPICPPHPLPKIVSTEPFPSSTMSPPLMIPHRILVFLDEM